MRSFIRIALCSFIFHVFLRVFRVLYRLGVANKFLNGNELQKQHRHCRNGDVQEMRKLLLDHGAKETKDDKKRWELREYTDKNERAWLMRFHRDDREV